MNPAISHRREKYFIVTLAGIQFCHLLDFMIMMPLGPILMEALGINSHEFGLLVASYSFSAAVSGILAATFVDRFDRKQLMLTIFFMFGIATLACGLAPGYFTLLIVRGLTGAFGGIIGALVQTMIGDVIPYSRRAKASGTISTAFAVSTVAGVPLSLWLATYFQWRAPFIFIVLLDLLLILFGLRTLPKLRQHLTERRHAHPFSAMFEVLRNANHLRALLYSSLIIFSGFTIIPYITIYAVNNIGISQHDIPIVYLFGGTATLFSARLIGHWADQYGKVKIYRWLALAAIFPLLLVTHIGVVSLPVWLICTTSFFVLISGRMIPAITIITSAAEPRLRGTFMSLNSTVQSLSMGMATMFAGAVMTQNTQGEIIGYHEVGYIAVSSNILAILFVTRIVIHDRQGQ
ncbi:MAG: MFS transporter [Magnetococcales bacterium]|nr:MFS transporter [Magnetococcales bacterium]